MAVPVLRAGILVTVSAVAVGAALYENHEPFRDWADDVKGRAEAAWIGLKSDLKELHEDIQSHTRRREAPWGAQSGQWEGVGGGRDVEIHGPWRRRRRSTSHTSEEREVKQEAQASGVDANEQKPEESTVRRRRGSTTPHEERLDRDKIAAGALADEEILQNSAHESYEEGRSRASTETLRSVEEINHGSAMLTPTTSASDMMDVEDVASVSGLSAVSGASRASFVEGDQGIMTPSGSGVLTPTSSSADELIDLNELRAEADVRSETGTETLGGSSDDLMEDARSEVSSVSDWSRVSEVI